MKKYILLSLALVLAFGAVFMSGGISQATAKEPKILEFDSMVGLPPAYTGSQNPIRGIAGGGLPWSIGSSYGELKANGKLEITVNDLVFSAGPNTGKNTVPTFRAIVSCLASDGSTVNVTTEPFPATVATATDPGGDAKLEAKLSLPQPCIAPIVFVTSPGGAWFATTGK
jgi:hypothetical protein